ncbi:MAG TPA: glycosyltransferase 87 family protein [Candidatus Tumulicola sp.]
MAPALDQKTSVPPRSTASSRATLWAIGIVLAAELAALPWTGHAYDVASFLSHADRVYFAHVPPTRLWAFGSIPLLALLISQLPMLFFPQIWRALPLRIFILKLPAWCADVVSAGIIRACSADPRLGNGWALRYLLDPIVVFVTVFHGQADALPNAFAVAGIAATLYERYELAGLLFGLGAGAKFYPAAFVPLLVVVAYRRASWRRALLAALTFGAAAALTLLPVFWGRAGSIAGAWANNSFGPEGNRVATASLWTLLPQGIAINPQFEQLAAVAIPLLLAVWELRHVPDRRDIARAAMLTAGSIVLLNPGAHPPFFLWIAGPLVLYAAVADDGIVSLAGIALSCLAIFTQFCQEGSDEYFSLVFGRGPNLGWLRCVAPFEFLQKLVLLTAAAIVVASWVRRRPPQRWATAIRLAGQAAASIIFVTFAAAAAAEVAFAAATHADRVDGFAAEEALVNTFAVAPRVEALADGSCRLTYEADDILVYAGEPFAARFATASLGYTLFSSGDVTIRGRTFPVASLPSTFERRDVLTLGQKGVRLTREFDVSSLLRPFRYVERIVERPCTLVDENPVLIYRFNFDAAHAAAAATPLFERLNLLRRTVQETVPPPIKGAYHA